MYLILMYLLATIVFTIVYAFVKFRGLMFVFEPTTLEQALQQVGELISERDRLEDRIAELEDQLRG